MHREVTMRTIKVENISEGVYINKGKFCTKPMYNMVGKVANKSRNLTLMQLKKNLYPFTLTMKILPTDNGGK